MSKLDNLQNKLDMWQRTATMYGSINVTLTPTDVVQLHQDVAVLYARIAELERDFDMLFRAVIAASKQSRKNTQTQTFVYGKGSDDDAS